MRTVLATLCFVLALGALAGCSDSSAPADTGVQYYDSGADQGAAAKQGRIPKAPKK
jgi:hypothetical protein